MPLGRSLPDGIDRFRLAVAVVVVPLLLVIVVASGDHAVPSLLGVVVLGVGWICASVFDAVRWHEYYHLANAIWLSVSGLLLLVAGDDAVPLVVVFLGLGAAGIVAEAYNLRNGTTYLRYES